MLQNLRDKAQGWIAWVIIGLIGITFVLFGSSNLLNREGSEKVIAKVNGKKISERELDSAYDRLLQQPGNESLRNLDPKAVKKELLQSIIDQTILLQQALQLGMRVSPAYVTSTLAGFPFLQQDGHFSQEAYAQFLSKINYTDSGFRELLSDSFVREQLQQGIMQTAFALNADLDEAVALVQQKRDFRYIVFPRDQYEKEVTVSADDIKAFYDKHRQNFMTDEKIQLEYVHLSLQDFLNKFTPSLEEVKHFYQENIHAFSTPERAHVAHILITVPKDADAETVKKAQAKIQEIQQKLKAGSSFADLAKQYSDDKGSSDNGGVLEWFSKGELLPSFEQAAFALKDNEVSGPVQTEYGFHLIKMLEKQPEKVPALDSIRKEVAEKLKTEVAMENFANALDQLNTLAYDTPDSLQPAADKLDLTVHKSELFSAKQQPKDQILRNPAVLAAAFGSAVKEDKNNSDLIKIDDNNYVVLRAADYVPPMQKPLEEVTPQIEALLKEEKSSALAKSKAAEALAEVENTKQTALGEVLKKFTWKDSKDMTRFSHALDPDLIEAAFSLPNQLADNQRLLKVAKLSNGDYALVWVTGITNGDPSTLTKEEKDGYYVSLIKHYGELEYALFADDLLKKAKIKNYMNQG